MLSALGNQGVQRLLREDVARESTRAVQRQGAVPGPEPTEDDAAAEEGVTEAGSDSEQQAAPEADIYELSPDVVAAGPVAAALVQGALGDLEAGGPGAEERASEKEHEALGTVDEVQPEVEGFGNDLLLSQLRGLRQSLLLDTTILRPYVGEDAVGLDSAQKHLRNVSTAFVGQFTEQAAKEAEGAEASPEGALPETEPGAGA
jgi:hypothetical protein